MYESVPVIKLSAGVGHGLFSLTDIIIILCRDRSIFLIWGGGHKLTFYCI